ncbi:MAG: hypothetical protein GXO79_08410 [Chlorobi bacterium]|nr:hypothetical protein [Chlorobiota bacterium]
MRINYIILIIGLLIGNTTLANNQFEFVNDCLDVYAKLNSATTEFYSTLENNTNSDVLKKAISEYNNKLVIFSMNKLLKHSKSENKNIQEVATDLRSLITDLVKMNYDYLNFVTNSKYTEMELKKKSESLIMENKFASGFFREISLGIVATLVKDKPNKQKDVQYSELTLKQRNSINEKLKKYYGNSIKKGTKVESKTPFEYSSRLIYEFLNMEWEFKKE